ncbi:BcSTC4, sesquiterpene cyclase [Metarhizium guizhouense ARSEF 977]|uniref:BcSTC4, sesquiterpene cyclase n=1 Tax=Metarhizium guizhouense (strain ARSEF 977) TaxID=1276136 RepID=A0A0B4GWK0_METGA|nr:BcSTC4, sesquiterpene cyclase [Metarhizium guizhouense ARSEF 977]
MDLIRSLVSWFLRPRVTDPGTRNDFHSSSSSYTSSHTTLPSAPTNDLRSIVDNPEDLKYLSPIRYAYDPVSVEISYLEHALLRLQSRASQPCPYLHQNSVRLHPARAGLPYRSSLDCVRGCKHFAVAIDESKDLLKKIMMENSAADIPVGDAKVTLTKLAEHELRPGLEDRMMLATSYMFPAANERRLRIIAVLMIMYFIFDGKSALSLLESCTMLIRLSQTKLRKLPTEHRKDFFSHFDDPETSKTEPISDFHRHTQATMKAIKDEDEAGGNGGKEMVSALRDAFRCVHPNGDFKTLEEYLQFRRLNVGARFVIAAAKFTTKSSVEVKDPRFSRYLSLIGDHLGMINDMASYEKEARALRLGETKDMINIVSVFHQLLSLPDEKAAKAAAYAYQLQVESWIMEEIERLAKNETLTDEEWWFLEVVLLTATGNTIFCMTSARYGGKAAAIEPMWYPKSTVAVLQVLEYIRSV